MQISDPTQRLCRLLVDWPRQSLAAWLAQQPSPLDVLTTKAHPPNGWRRKTPNQRFLTDCKLPKPLREFRHVAIGIFDAEFPLALKNIPDPPLVLFCLGNIGLLDRHCISVVGARRCTTLGKTIAHSMAAELAQSGHCVVSGLALGVDAAAHRGALAAAGCRSALGQQVAVHGIEFGPMQTDASSVLTIAVLGSGLGRLYPKQHSNLAKTLLRTGGLIVTEYPSATEPRPHQFPERNQLISGLSSITVLVEAGEKSGSLITARLALEQGRDVCAVPGSPHSPVSHGCHRMIRQGAALVTCARDVLEELGLSGEATASLAVSKQVSSEQAQSKSQAKSAPDAEAKESGSANHPADNLALSNLAANVLEVLAAEALHFDEILSVTRSSAQQVSNSLIELQLAGFVRQGPDGYIRVL
jgi:DNA processing protein